MCVCVCPRHFSVACTRCSSSAVIPRLHKIPKARRGRRCKLEVGCRCRTCAQAAHLCVPASKAGSSWYEHVGKYNFGIYCSRQCL